MDEQALWKRMREALEAIVLTYQPLFNQFLDDTRLEPWSIGILLAALTFEPEPTSAASMRVRSPYTAPSAYRERLVKLAQSGYMLESAPGEYRLNLAGRQAIERLVRDGRQAMADADPLSAVDSQRLAALLGALVESCLNAPPPPGNWSIRLSHRLMPPLQPPLPFAEQALSCLNAYRDDAHLAAWQPAGISATALETLTLVWRDGAASLAEICQALHRRGHSPSAYEQALEELRGLGYIEAGEPLVITPAGAAFRKRVEQRTDDYFFKPWAGLAEEARNDLAALLIRLTNALSMI